MKRTKFTELTTVLMMTALCTLPLAGQEKVAVKMSAGEAVPEQRVQLRAAEYPDSIIAYNALGERIGDNSHRRERELAFYEVHSSGSTNVLEIPSLTDWYMWWRMDTWSDGFHPVRPTYNENGQISRLVIEHTSDFAAGTDWLSLYFTYNEEGRILSILDINHDGNNEDHYDYQYNKNGDRLSYEYARWQLINWANPDKGPYKRHFQYQVAKFDSRGRKIREERYVGNSDETKYLLDEYDIYYYSDGYNPSVTPGDNPPIDGGNRGGFEMRITLPVDSIAGGSFVIRLPDGFTLDEGGTALSVDFGDFELVITKQADNSWLLEIRPKAGVRSATLRADDVVRALAHIAYTVDERTKYGTYDITVHSITFETPGGDAIVEPAFTVPVSVNRWGVGNEPVDGTHIWSSAGTLHVRSAQSATLHIYTPAGTLHARQTLPAGATTLSLPPGMYIVKVGNKTEKVVIGK